VRLAFVVEEVHRRGGPERVVAELASRLSRRHEVHIYGLAARDIASRRIIFHQVRCPWKPPSFRALRFPSTSARALKGETFDAVIGLGANCLAADWALLHTCQARRIRVVRERIWPRHPPSTGARLQHMALDRFRLRAEKRMAEKCRGRLIAVSGGLRRDFCAEYGLGEDEIAVAPSGVDSRVFRPPTSGQEREVFRKALNLPRRAFVVLFAGESWLEGGLDCLIEAVGLCKSRPTLVVIGTGPKAQFRAIAEKAGAADRVIFAGHADHPEHYYRAANCAAVPSHEEGCSLAALEAAASGLPVVMTETGIACDLIEDRVSGFLVPLDAAMIAGRLDRLAESRSMGERLGQEARRSAQRFTWDAQAQAVETLLKERASSKA
jgi:UDP-glucose:(heptosyl)LPS alpha-1,3-glucosyltransferase